MIDLKTLRELCRKSKTDCFNWIGVFIVCVTFGVEVGLLFGILFNFSFLIMRLTNPKIEVILKTLNGFNFIHVTPCSEIYYSGAEHLRNTIQCKCNENDNMFPVVINCQKLIQNDYTIMMILKTIIRELEDKNVQVYLQNLNSTTAKYLCKTGTKAIFCNSEIELQVSFSKS